MMKVLKELVSLILAHLFVYIKRRYCLLIAITGGCIVLLLLKWRFVCSNLEPHLHIQYVCNDVSSGKSVGNICEELCHTKEVAAISCHSLYMEKEAVFSATWRNDNVVFKTAKKTHNDLYNIDLEDNVVYPSEDEFTYMIKSNIKSKYNISINDADAKKISFLQIQPVHTRNRYVEMENIWTLVQDNEYLAMYLYEKFEIFPKILGSCGSLYAVQKLNSIAGFQHLLDLYDSQHQWVRRVKLAMFIIDYLKKLEADVPEPLLICDVKMNHFGVTNDFKKVMYLDLDSVHPVSIVNSKTADGSYCKEHSDCDFKDCRSFCNLVTFKCQYGVANNNLQIVCERIFLGWVMSGRVMVPGLLLGPRAPRALIEMLESCANPLNEPGIPRAPASTEIRKRLYVLLKELALS